MVTIIKQPNKEQLKELAKLYKLTFQKHNIFNKDEKFILNYLKTKPKKILIALTEDESELIGGLCLFENKQTDNHSVWNFKHISVKVGNQGKGIGASLILEAQAYCKENDKVEIKISENEKPYLKFYEKMNFHKEGELSNHYRINETCYIFGKTIKK